MHFIPSLLYVRFGTIPFFFMIVATLASDGTIMGEYGHLTADGFYITTVYSTNSKGKYSIMERRKERAGERSA